MITAIAFDFDGVLVDSNRLKYDAWFRLFPASENISKELIQSVLLRITQTRFDILREIFTQAGRATEQVEDAVAQYAKAYGTLVKNRLATDGLIPGVKDTLDMLSHSYRLYVNSATPEQALYETISILGIKNYFHNAYGTPATKKENLKKIMNRERIPASQILMVGDGEGDWEAARALMCPFVGIANGWNQWEEREFNLIRDLRALPEILTRL